MRLRHIFELNEPLPPEQSNDPSMQNGAQPPMGGDPSGGMGGGMGGQPPMGGGMGPDPALDDGMGGQPGQDVGPDGNPVLPDNGVDPEEVMAGLEDHPFMDYEYPDEQYNPVNIVSLDRGALVQLEKDTSRHILELESADDDVGQYQNVDLQFYKDAKNFIERVKERLGDLTNDEDVEDSENDEEFNPQKKRDDPDAADETEDAPEEAPAGREPTTDEVDRYANAEAAKREKPAPAMERRVIRATPRLSEKVAKIVSRKKL